MSTGRQPTEPPVPGDGDFSDGAAGREWVDPVVIAEAQWRGEGWRAGARLRAAMSVVRMEELIRTDNAPIMRAHHLTHSRHAALALLYFSADGQLPMNQLSEHLMVHPTSVTSTVDALEKYGHVVRVAHPNDRRTTLARITDSGRAAIEETCTWIGKIDFSLGALSDAEAHELYRLLAKVRYRAGEIQPSDPGNE